MFGIRLVNFGYDLDGRYQFLREAIYAARDKGFEALVFKVLEDGTRVSWGSWSPISGYRPFPV